MKRHRALSFVRYAGAGYKAMVPLLEALVKHSDLYWLRDGIHHVLHDVNRGKVRKVLQPVLSALEETEPSLEVPPAAQATLDALKKSLIHIHSFTIWK